MNKLIKFEATWCGPCRMVAPLITEYSDKYNVEIVDVDEAPERAATYDIRALPTVIIQNNENQEVARFVGSEVNKANLNKFVTE